MMIVYFQLILRESVIKLVIILLFGIFEKMNKVFYFEISMKMILKILTMDFKKDR